MSIRGLAVLFGFAAATLCAALPCDARPLYFDSLTRIYGISPGEDLYACGVCHRRWEGTGGRNPYGSAVEQQLYIGSAIDAAIRAVEADDSDADGFTNLAELTTFGKLPAYSCENFDLVINPPSNFQSLITPGVASCLDPKDLLVEPTEIAFITEGGFHDTVTAELINFGTDFPITVSAIEILSAHPSLMVDAPSLPIVIPVGASAFVDVSFAPTTSGILTTALRVTSDDPDEPQMDVPLSALGVVFPTASPEARTACLAVVDKQYRTYSKRHLAEWSRCFVAEVSGQACDTGRRDLKTAQAADKLRSYVGGENDRDCAGNGLSPTLLRLPTSCTAPCEDIVVTSMAAFADCLVCRQEAAASAMLSASVGVTPPDLPASTSVSKAAVCQKVVAKGASKGIIATHKALAACELANISAASPVDCTIEDAAELASIAEKTNQQVERCKDSTGLLGCPFGEGADPNCLGDAAVSIGTGLVETSFGVRSD